MAKSFEDTVSDITEKYGARGFTAKKTAAADLLKGEIDTVDFSETDQTTVGVAANVLDRLSTVQSDLDASRDPEGAKEALSAIKEIKDTIKILKKSQDLDDKQFEALDGIIDRTEKNVKKTAKAGSSFGKANQNFLENLTDTLNPLKGIGSLLDTMGLGPLANLANDYGDILSEKFLSFFNVGGTSDEAIKSARNARDQRQSEIDTADQEQAVKDQSVLTKEGETSKKGIEEGEGSMTAEDLLIPSLALVKRARTRLGFALGLTDTSGKPYLGMLVDFMKPDPSSRGEVAGTEGGLDLPALKFGDGDAEVPDDVKPKGIFARLFGVLRGTFNAIFGGLLLLITNPFKLIKGLVGKIGTGIVARIGLRGALAGTLAGIPIVGWLAALVIQGLFGIFGGLKGVYEEGKNNPDATIKDKLFAFFDGFISEFFTFGAVSREKIAEFRGKIKQGFLDVVDGIYDGVKNAIDNAIESVKNIGATIKDFGGNILSKGKDFLKGAIRSILPRKDDDGGFFSIKNIAMKAIPEAVYKFAGIDKETGEDIPEPPKVQTADIEGVDARQGLTSTMQTAMSDMSNASYAGDKSGTSVAVNNGGNVSTVNNTTNNTTTNASPQDNDFDYYAFRGVNVHA